MRGRSAEGLGWGGRPVVAVVARLMDGGAYTRKDSRKSGLVVRGRSPRRQLRTQRPRPYAPLPCLPRERNLPRWWGACAPHPSHGGPRPEAGALPSGGGQAPPNASGGGAPVSTPSRLRGALLRLPSTVACARSACARSLSERTARPLSVPPSGRGHGAASRGCPKEGGARHPNSGVEGRHHAGSMVLIRPVRVGRMREGENALEKQTYRVWSLALEPK